MKVVGKFKDELNGKRLLKFVGLRPKLYSLLVEGEEEGAIVCKNTAKGVRKSVKDMQISFEDYEHALTTLERYICDDGISTLAHGHCDIAHPHGKKRERVT